MTEKERKALLRMQRKQNITGTAGVQTSDTQQAVADVARANNVPYYQQFANEASDWQAQEAERKKNEPPDYDALHAQIMQGVEQRKKQWEYEHSKEYKLANSKYADAYRQIGLLKDKPYEPQKTAKDSFFSFDPQEFKTKLAEKAAANQQYQDRLRQDANNLWLQNLTMPAEIGERPEGTPAELPPVPESPSVLDYINYFLQRGSVGVENMMEGIETGVNRFGAALGGFLGDEVLAPGSSVQGRSTGFSRPAQGMQEPPKNTLDAIKQNVANTVDRMNKADLRVLEESTKNSQVDKKRDEINQKYANVASTGVGQVLGDLSETVSPMLLEAAFWNTAWADVPALSGIMSGVQKATAGMNPMQAQSIISAVRGLPLALTRGALSAGDSYAAARKSGATPQQAKMFAGLESVNQGVGELLLNGVGGMGSGLAQAVPAFGKVGKFLARAYGTAVKSPAMKTALRYSGNIVGEALEEIIQSGATTLNKRMTYDPGAKFDIREASYEGLLAGITAAALGLPDAFTDAFGTSKGPDGTPIYEGYYYMYRADYDAINNFSKAAASVSSEADAADIRAYGEELIKGFDAVLADNSINFETRAETEYLKHGIQTVLNQMDTDLDSIIYYNEAFDDAVDAVGDADADDYVDDVANLVTVVGENADPDADIVRETVDRVNNEIRDNIETEQEVASMTDEEFVEWMRTARLTGELEGIANAMRGQQTNLLLPGNPSVDPTNSRNVEAARQRVIQELRIRRELLQRINGALRNQKSEITAIVSGMLDQEIAAQNSGLQNAAGRGIINQESTVLPNPVMQADGKSLIPQAEIAAPAEPGGTKYDLVHTEYTHTKTGAKMNLYRFNGNLSDDDYKALKKAVGSVGGYWNKFAKGFVVPDDGVPKLADALGKINVGIDESQYRPTAGAAESTSAQTAQPGETVRTPNESTVPKIEVVGDDGSVRTDTAERPKAPEFEVYEGGGDLVPAGAQTAMQGTDASVPGVQGNAGPSFDTDAGTGAGTQGGNAAPQVQGAAGSGKTRTPVNAQGTEKDEDDEWDDAVRALGEKWDGISAREFIQALDTVYETLAETTPKTEDGKYDMRSLDAETVQRAATDLSRDLIREASVKEDNPEYETAREALRYLRTTPMYYDRDKMIAELGGKYEYNRWKKSMFGKLRLVTDRSRGVKAVDEIFPEFAEQFPGIVDLTAWNELDQLRELAQAVEELRRNGKQVDVNPYDIDRNGAETELAVDLVTEAMNRLIGYKPERPWNAKKPTEPEVKAEKPKTEAKPAEKPKASEPEEKPAEKTSSSAYDELAEKLRTHDLVETNGLTFRVYFHSGPRTYSGRIEEIPEVLPNGVPIYNARGVKYDTGDKATRDEAVSELLTVAKNSRLFSAKDDGRKTEKPKKEEPEANPAERPSEKPAEEPESAPAASGPYVKIADWVSGRLKRGLDIDKKDLQVVANDAYGGTMAEGAYDVKDMTDALELGVNQHIIDKVSHLPKTFNSPSEIKTREALRSIEDLILSKIPTQTNRTDEQIKLQQFSTPPNIAFLANWVANIDGTDTMLEPSAGIGGLASFAKGMGAKVVVNELSDRRLDLLKTLPFDGFYHENAEQIDNILPDDVKPTVVVMNPPFSANGRTKNKTANAIPHIEQALERLEDGGRLVAILGGGRDAGGGMSDSAPAFKQWWNDLRDDYSIRANIGIDGKNYKKYGTSFNVRLVVIDKTGKQEEPTLTGEYEDLNEAIKDLEEIRNDRHRSTGKGSTETESNGTVKSGSGASQGGAGKGNVTGTRAGERNPDSGADNAGGSDVGGQRPVSDLLSERGGEPDRGSDVVADGAEGAVSSDDAELRPGRGGQSVDAGSSAGDHAEQRPGGMGAGDSGDGADRKPEELVRPAAGIPGAAHEVIKDTKRTPKKQSENDDGVYASYQTAKLTVKGAKPHPAKLVESSAMSAVSSPTLTYTPTLDPEKIKNGTWSDAQLENISYAGQAHSEKLPDGQRKGYFIGDGTGVGKGRQLAGIIMDNFNQGRRRAIWISENADLMQDAKRDWKDVGGDPNDIFPFSDTRKKGGVPKNGIMFVPYTTLPSESKKMQKDNLSVIEEWFGKGFDGVIVFDEAHNMGNLTPVKGSRGKSKPSQKAIAGNKLQSELPNARVVYASATGATKIENLAYASRLGLWGEKTAFRDTNDFISKIGSAGLSAMELVARDMKAMGVYLARSISYDGVVYDNLTHNLTRSQIAMYDRMSDGWQVVLQNFDKAMELTGSEDAQDVKQSRRQIYGNMQLFYNQVLTSFATPSVIKDIEKELAKDHSCVIQLVNTQESATKEQIQKAKEEGRSLDDVDVTPRQLLVGFVERYFPIYQYEEYLDEAGNTQVRRVEDSQGNPVVNKKALRMKEDLIADLNEISIPDGPLDMIINHFGTDNVAEITGRTQRLVTVTDENGRTTTKIDKRDANKAKIAETAAFQNGDKRILVFSGAGSTGRSFHADKRAKNQQQRIHYVLQPGWQADKAVQGFGRTHRSNQVSAPVFRLVRTDVEGHKRFVTSIARRLDQLGALTKGQRQTGSGVFGEKDNLESPLSTEALKSFYRKLGGGSYAEFDPKDILQKMGLAEKFYDDYDNFNPNADVAGEITTFLNRLLALHVEEQNDLFRQFEKERDIFYNQAIESGTLDTGLENVRADKIEIEQEDVVYTDKKTGAETKYVKAKLFNKPRVLTTVEAARSERDGFVGIFRMKDGSVRAAYRVSDATDARTGEVIKRYVLVGPNQGKASRYAESTFKNSCEKIPEKEWQSAWDEEVQRVPEYNEGEAHMITGALLPIWDKLPQGGNVKARRIIASDGSQYLGRVIEKSMIDQVLRGLNVNVQQVKYTGKDLYDAIMSGGKTVLLNGSYGGVYTIGRRRVANETRIEISGGNMYDIRTNYPDLITETVQYARRYFIPTGKKGEKLLGDLAERYGVRSVENEDDTGNMYSAGLSAGKWGKGDRDKEAEVKSVSDLVKEAQRIFGIPINVGRMNAPRGVSGMYKEQLETIRTRKYGDIPDIAHEVGHHFDKKYKLRESPYIDTLVSAFQKELAKKGYSPLLFRPESVAEYFSAYMLDRPKTEKKFRKFTEWLNQTLSETDLKKLNDFTDMSNGYFSADEDRRANAQIHYRTEDSTLLRRTQEKLDDAKRNPREFFGDLSRSFVRNWFDDLVDLRGFGDTYDLAYYEKQAKSIAYGRLVYGMTDRNGNVIGKSLAEILSDGNITEENRQTFDAYLVACIALDRIEAAKAAAERGEEVATLVYADEELGSEDKLIDRIERYERENPTFHKTAAEVYDYENQLMDVAVASGLVSEDLVNYLRSIYPHYVPLYRVMDDKSQRTRGAKRGYEGQSSPIARFKGSGRDIYSPIENIIMNTEKYTVSAMRNDVMTEFCDFIDENEGMGWAAEKIPPAKILDFVSTDEIGKRLKEFTLEGDRLDALSEKERAKFYEAMMSFIGDFTTQWKPSGKKGHNVVSVMRNGNVQYYEVHDPGVYKALTNMDAPQWDMVTKFFGTLTRFEKGMFTSTNPQFIFTNPQRDLVTGFISSTTTDNPFTYVKDMVTAFVDAVRGDETYQRYMQSGGGYMGSLTSDYNVLRRVSKEVVKGDKSQIKRFGDMIADFVPRLVDAGETASRLAEWKRAVAQGADNMEAMRKAQEITVNFARGGKIVKQINQYIPFFQAGFSALAHDYDLFVNGGGGGGGRDGGNGFGLNLSPEAKRRRAHAWAKWLLTTAFLALLTWLVNFLLSPKITGESEEEVMQKWDDLSNYNKNAYYNLYIGNGKFIRWKKTQDMAIAASIVERMMEYAVLDQKDSLNGLADYVCDNMLSISTNPMDTLSDVTLIGPIFQLARNADFKGTPIVPMKFKNDETENREQYNNDTSTIAIALGDIFNASPIELQFLSESYFGWAARLVNNLTPYNGERSLGLKTKLIADSAYSTDIINNFYDQKKVYDKAANGYKRNPTSNRYSLEDVYGAFKYDKVAQLYSNLTAVTREEPDNDLSRSMKIQTNALIQTVNEDGISELDRSVLDLADRVGITDITSIAPYIIVPDKLTVGSGANKVSLPMEYDDMVLYYNQSQTAFEEAYSRIMQSGYSDEMIAQAMAQAKTAINNGLREAWKQRLVARKMGE